MLCSARRRCPVRPLRMLDRPNVSVAEPVDEIAPVATLRRFDFASWALGAAVLICAVLLGIVLGRDIGVQRARVRPHRSALPSLASATQTSLAARTASVNPRRFRRPGLLP